MNLGLKSSTIYLQFLDPKNGLRDSLCVTNSTGFLAALTHPTPLLPSRPTGVGTPKQESTHTALQACLSPCGAPGSPTMLLGF